ncbi:MAG TPA: hypothetical protein VD948_05125 [Rhodothermales bacterium]|nr:hypothetical protein [Rhodothermales bacterium]
MRKPRKLKNPENYCSPAEAAAQLRKLAADLERGPDWVTWYLNLGLASPDDVAYSFQCKHGQPHPAIAPSAPPGQVVGG